jgi:predicted alpha/beta superfamily hydrolase
MRAFVLGVCCALGSCAAPPPAGRERNEAAPLVIGESFTLDSNVMHEARHINVFRPTVYGRKVEGPLPVLYMPDGGMDEDFLHIAGLVQVLVSDGSMRPFLLVGIENTQRRRDMTGPTTNPEDRKIAPEVGGSAVFRRFIKEELMPRVRARYVTTDEAAIMGESLAGLFVVETFFLDPELFRTYIAIDPSLWWADQELLKKAPERLGDPRLGGRSLFLACSNEPVIAKATMELAGQLDAHRPEGLTFLCAPLPVEGHGTIYHPAALLALRASLAPKPAADGQPASAHH